MPGRILSAAAAALLCASGMTLAAPAAHADHDGKPTPRELLDKCNNGTDVCEFHPSGPPEYFTGQGHVVGLPAYNCTGTAQRTVVGWSDTTGESNSFGVSLGAEYGFAEVFKVSIEVSYGHTWETSHTEKQDTWVEVPAGHKGWVERAPRMKRVGGTYEMHFPDRYYGHYIWYQGFTATAPDGAGTISQHTAPMTEQERAEHCG
jgi:opacity protein-like surface antigen